MLQLHTLVRNWMNSAGLVCRLDAAGNLLGRLDAPSGPYAPTLLVGSHLDTVPNGGRYDGLLGVVLGIALAEAIKRSETQLPLALEIIGFSEEEGVRFGTPFIGSRAVIGDCDPTLLARTDAHGISVRTALESFGCDVAQMAAAEISPRQVMAFLEPHIEQGPVLQSHDKSLGVVTAIAGQTRAHVCFVGAAGHAGTVPMHLRRDALAAAAEWITWVEKIGLDTSGLVATVGVVEALPGVGNVIPGEARVRLDLRHADDAIRTMAVDRLRKVGSELAAQRNVHFQFAITLDHPAVAMDKTITGLLRESVKVSGIEPLQLVSGAGHDAAVMARRFPTAMLFIRCRDGISHHPDESITEEDLTAALNAMWHFVQRLARTQAPI